MANKIVLLEKYCNTNNIIKKKKEENHPTNKFNDCLIVNLARVILCLEVKELHTLYVFCVVVSFAHGYKISGISI